LVWADLRLRAAMGFLHLIKKAAEAAF